MGFPGVGSDFPSSGFFCFWEERRGNLWMEAVGLSGQNYFG